MRYIVEILLPSYVTVDAENARQAAEIALDCLDLDDATYEDSEVINVEEAKD